MGPVVRSNVTLIWLLLGALTVASCLLGTGPDRSGGGHAPISLIIIAIAVFKVRLIGMYFMDLRDAPPALHGMFEVYCLILFGLIVGMFRFG